MCIPGKDRICKNLAKNTLDFNLKIVSYLGYL